MNWGIFYAAKIFCAVRRRLRNRLKHFFRLRQNVAVLKNDGLGDLILWIPYARAVRSYYPAGTCKLFMLVSPAYRTFAESLGCADKVIVCPPYKNPWQWLFVRIFFWLRYHFDVVINAACLPNDILAAYDAEPSLLLTREDAAASQGLFRNIIDVRGMTIFQRYEVLLRHLNIPLPNTLNFTLMKNNGDCPEPTAGKKYFSICAGAGDLKRCWNEEKFAELIDALLEEVDAEICLLGSSGEYDKSERIRNSAKNTGKIINYCGKTTVESMASLIAGSLFLVTNETGTAHLGAVAGIKTFIICGGGDYGAFVPYPEKWRNVFSIFGRKRPCFGCLWKPEECAAAETYPCIEEIQLTDVLPVIIPQLP